MEEWKEYRLSDFMEFNPTVRLSKNTLAKKVTMDQLVPRCRDIYNWSFEPYSGGAKFQNGDTIMARITPCLENGKHSFVSFLDDNEIAYGSTEYIVIRGREGISDNLFVYYLSHYPEFKNTAVKSMVGSSGRQRAQVDVLENIIMSLPPLPEQHRIANFLSSLDDKIAVNRRINDNLLYPTLLAIQKRILLLKRKNDNLEQHAQALFKSWFVDFEPFKDGEFVESEMGMIPKNLIVKRVSEIPHTIETGRRPKGGVGEITSGVPSVGAEHVKGLGNYDYSKTKYITEGYAASLKTGKVNGYELLIYKDGGKPGYFIPNYSIFGEGYPFEECFLNEHVFKLDFGNKEYNAFCYFYFWTDYVMNYLNAQGGKAAIPGINKQDVENIMIFAPDNEMVKRFGDFVLPMIKQILFNCKENHRLAILRDTLLPRLMSGKLKVNKP